MLSATGIAICAIAAGFVLFQASRPAAEQLSQRRESDRPTRPPVTALTPNPTVDRPSAETVDSAAVEERMTLETFDSANETATVSESAIDSELSMSLEGLLPPIDDTNQDSNSKLSDASNTSSGTAAEPESAAQDSDSPSGNNSNSNPQLSGPTDSQISDEEPVPEESPQQTRQSTVSAVQLGDLANPATIVTLADHPLTGLDVRFPMDVPLEVNQEDTVWSIRDTRKDLVVATIRSTEDGTEFSWGESAENSPSAGAVAHGRITSEGGRTVFLRPTVESDPWKFQFDQSDVMPTWNLNHPIPPRVTRLSVEFELPADCRFRVG